MNRKGLTLLEVFVLVVVIGILAALALPPTCGGGRTAKRINCQHHLAQLYKLAVVYASSHHGEWPPPGNGPYWLSLTKTTPPLIGPDELEVLACPLREEELAPGTSDYRGPRLPWKQLKASDPVIADRPGNHGEGEKIHVVLKDGAVLEVGPDDPLWKRCQDVLEE